VENRQVNVKMDKQTSFTDVKVDNAQDSGASAKPQGADTEEGEPKSAIADAEDEVDNKEVSRMCHLLNSEDDVEEEKKWLVRLVSSAPFEMAFGLLIVLNTLQMCCEAEYRGLGTGHEIGIAASDPINDTTDTVFRHVEIGFGIVFTAEVVMKLLALRFLFWHSAWNIFDFVVIAIAWFDLMANVDLFLNPMLLRLVRLVRLIRLLRGLSAFEVFDNLHLMVRGIKASTPVLIWVIFLVFPMIACCSLGMNFTLVDYIVDVSKPRDQRLQCYEYFGTFTRSFLSMFEVSFASWVPICRFLYEHVDPKYAIFFMGYQLLMGIAVLRIIYGVFLHVTFACASSDDETVILKKKRENKKYAEKMHALFQKFDASGDGYLTREEFRLIGNDPRIKTWLSAMELELHDAELVFDLADDGDGQLSAKEMVYGFSRLKGTARSIDIWALMSLTKKAMNKLDKVAQVELEMRNEMHDHDKAMLGKPVAVDVYHDCSSLKIPPGGSSRH
jgi:voltage-gated sodium channel